MFFFSINFFDINTIKLKNSDRQVFQTNCQVKREKKLKWLAVIQDVITEFFFFGYIVCDIIKIFVLHM